MEDESNTLPEPAQGVGSGIPDTLKEMEEEGIPTPDEPVSSDEEDKMVEDDELVGRLLDLENQLKANPNLYKVHVAYIAELTSNNLLQKARAARKAMHSRFALSEELWLEWLEVELEHAQTPEDLQSVCDIFDLGTQDYLSVDIWCQYFQFVVNCAPSLYGNAHDTVDKIRALAEKAIASGGLHASEGHNLWELVIKYEQSVEAACETHSERSAQEGFVRKLYHRALQVPLLFGDSLMKMYLAWESAHDTEGSVPPDHVLQGFTSAQEMVDLRRRFENAVDCSQPQSKSSPEILAGFLAYIKLEEAQKLPSRVSCMYERAIAVFPCTHSLWLKYASYVESTIQGYSPASEIYRRACRSCPWVGEIWARRIRLCTWFKQPIDETRAIYDQALLAGLQSREDYMAVILAWLDGIRHRKRFMEEGRPGFISIDALREEFKQAVDVMNNYFPDYVDTSHRIISYWAKCERVYGKDLDRAREIWKQAAQSKARKHFETWFLYAEMEWNLGHVKEATKVFKTALLSDALDVDNKARLCDKWVRFEREEGTPVSLRVAMLKFEQIMEEVARRDCTASKSDLATASKQAVDKAPKLSKEEVGGLKRKQQESEHKSRKKRKCEQENSVSGRGTNKEAKKQGSGKKQSIPAKEAKPYYSDQLTAFVKNLDRATTDAALYDIFKPCGDVKAVRHLRQPNGASRGFAYVEFASEEALEGAIKLSGTFLNGLAINVLKSEPRKGPNKLKPMGGEGGSIKTQDKPHNHPIHSENRRERRADKQNPSRARALDFNDKEVENSNVSSQKPLTNEDFRKML